MPPMNYSTTIEASKTMGEIQSLLVEFGVTQLAMTYENKAPTGVAFVAETEFGDRQFVIRADVDAVQAMLERQRKGYGGKKPNTNIKATREQAERVAWRVVKDFINAQMTMVEAGLSTLTKALMPYMMVDKDHTLFDAYMDQGLKALEA